MKSKKKQNGQVLIMSLVVLVALLLAGLLLFDLHNAIRGKIKLETAQQAAALTGANWQIEGLNLIGQLNLVKAVDTIEHIRQNKHMYEETQEEYIRRMAALTELQSRTAFIVPLLGVMALQQTAKHNGMPNSDVAIEYYANKILPHHDYRFEAIDGYLWHTPYSRLLGEIVQNGCAVRVNSRLSILPEVWSDNVGFNFNGMYRVLLSDRTLYEAIWYENFCHWQLNALAKAGKKIQSTWLDKVEYTPPPFCRESELLTLGVVTGKAAKPPVAADVGSTALPAPWKYPEETPDLDSYYLYDGTWFPDSYCQQCYDAHANNWSGGMWLRSDRRDEYIYEGAVTAVDNYVNMPVFNQVAVDRPAGGSLKLTPDNRKNIARTSGEKTNKIGRYSPYDSTIMGVVAKPLGAFQYAGQRQTPITTDIVLPVFTKSVLIPSTMPYNVGMATVGEDLLVKFLKWLNAGNDIHHDIPPDGTEKYQLALLKLEDQEFLRQGYNKNYNENNPPSPDVLFTDTYKYPQNPDGAGWLQQVWLGKTMFRPYVWEDDTSQPPQIDHETGKKTYPQKKRYLVEEDTVTTVTEIKEEYDGAVRTYLGNDEKGYRYYLTLNGKILTNEDIACGKVRSSGGGGGFIEGTHTGPSRL